MKIFTTRNILFFALWTLIIFLVLLIIYIGFNFNLEQARHQSAYEIMAENQRQLVKLEKKIMIEEFNRVIGDVLTAKQVVEYSFELNDNDLDVHYIEEQFGNIIRNKKNYDKFRYIDSAGDEVVKVELVHGEELLHKKNSLANVSDRYYFKDTFQLKNDEIYVSKFDLDVEKGKPNKDPKPVIRFCAKIYDTEGVERGIVITNYNAQIMLNNFKDIAETSYGFLSLVNQDGYWLYNPEYPNREFAFMDSTKQDVNFANYYPQIWSTLLEKDVYRDEKDILFSEKIIPFENSFFDEYIDFVVPISQIKLGGGNFFAIVHISKEKEANVFAITLPEYIEFVIAKRMNFILALFIIAQLVALMVMIYIVQHDKIKYYSEFDTLTNSLNRRSGIVRLNKMVKDYRGMGSLLVIIFVDINGLKVVNDTLGHKHGDQLIKDSAEIIASALRKNDIMFRYGGDEFIIGIQNAKENEIEVIWERILERVLDKNESNDNLFNISLSHGFSIIYPDDLNTDIKYHIDRADEMMYKEKKLVKQTAVIIKNSAIR